MILKQSFGSNDKSIYNVETDRITHLNTSDCSKYLFAGDSGGRIVVFNKKKTVQDDPWEPVFQYFGTQPKLDYLTNSKTDNKITGLIPLQYNDNGLYNIVSDTKNIYLHKLTNKKKSFKHINHRTSPFKIKNNTKTVLKHEFVNGHRFYLNSIALSKEMKYILSADDLTINMWDINRPEKTMPIIDCEPNDISTITSTITKMKPHPNRDNIIYTASSNGIISTFDIRNNSITKTPVKIMYSSKMVSYDSIEHIYADIGGKNTREHLKYISDFDISNDSRYIVTRSPLFINLWDFRNTLHPCHSYPIHKPIHSLIRDNHDLAFEPFEIKYSSNGEYIYSGSFDNIICINTRTCDINYTNERKLIDITINSDRYTCVGVSKDNCDVFASYNGRLDFYANE